ncbi:MAG TPA: 2-hydroxyacyl-CoA dehydratase family protein [Ruminococcus sp.]|nr:2-hydroxyacyl-CoA dehydratase family protein [Ruminococcus sp.]
MANNDKTSVYEWEYMDSFDRIWSQQKHLPEIKYFLDTEYSWAKNQCRPKVVILGTGIPEELAYACGAAPYWLIGGSLASTVWSDEHVPRDTDPVSRSILGYINRQGTVDFSDSLFIIPMTSDSMRKIAYQLKTEGRTICLVDIPPQRSDSKSSEKWQRQILDMTKAISEHTGSRITRSSMISAAQRISKARYALNAFLNISRDRPDIVPNATRLLIQDSYYRTFNINEWTYRLQMLTAKTAELTRRYAYVGQSRPKVMVMGSPIIFPNYKIPFLIDDVGLNLTDTVDSTFLKQYLIYEKSDLHGSYSRIIKNIASAWYSRDASSAFVRNDSMYHYIKWRINKKDVEGVVYHVLKGQIEQDFEFERFEMLFAEYGIPMFRLETDYQYQDIEQLRIRLEAFSEMLTQNRYKEVKQAK